MNGDRQAVREILGRYRVNKHWRASTAAGVPRYALYCNGKQVGEIGPSAEIRARAEESTISAIVDHFDRARRG